MSFELIRNIIDGLLFISIITRHLKDTGKKAGDYDLIVTGDLGALGSRSGAGCSALVFNSYLFDKLKNREINSVLLCATGALLSTVSSGQGESIPCICHAVAIENV